MSFITIFDTNGHVECDLEKHFEQGLWGEESTVTD